MLRALAFAALLTIGLGALVFVPTRTATSNSGGAAARNAGVPGENTCASSGCHSSFALNSGNGSVVVASADTYTPGTALDLTVRVAQSGSSTYGFQIAARDANGDPAGSFELADGGTRFSGSTTIGQRYVGHSTPSVSGEWSVRWLARSGAGGRCHVLRYGQRRQRKRLIVGRPDLLDEPDGSARAGDAGRRRQPSGGTDADRDGRASNWINRSSTD